MLVYLMMASLISSTLSQDYCSFSPQHTLCQFEGPGPDCNGAPLSRGVSGEEIEQILGVHNRLRAKLARGEEKRGKPGPQPPSANMRRMIWDPELANVAQGHADQCKFAHDCSDCRRVSRFGVGQNLYIYKTSVQGTGADWGRAVTDWYEEVTLFSNNKVDPFQFSPPTGHYTQAVWATTDKVGCGATSYKAGKWFSTLYTCNYGPGGNFIRGQMYETGPACSACPGQCSTTYPGLCDHSGNSSLAGGRPESPLKITTESPVRITTESLVRITTESPVRITTESPVRISTESPVRITTESPVEIMTTKSTFTKTNIKQSGPKMSLAKEKRLLTASEPAEKQQNTTSTASSGGLFRCGFEKTDNECTIRTSGKLWETKGLFNKYISVELLDNEKTEFVFKKLISPPRGQIACIDFRYTKYSADRTKSTLKVLAWPKKGRPGRVSISQDSPDLDTWVRAQVTLRGVEREFLLLFRAEGGEVGDKLTLKVDDVTVRAGQCDEV